MQPTSRGIFPGDLKSYPNGKLTQGNRRSSGASDGSRLINRGNRGHPRLMCPNRRAKNSSFPLFADCITVINQNWIRCAGEIPNPLGQALLWANRCRIVAASTAAECRFSGSAAFSTFSRVPRVARELSTLPARVHHTTRAENAPQSPEHTIATMMTLAHAPVVAPVVARASVR